MQTLKRHIREAHPKKDKCDNCDEEFDEKFKLEHHMNEKHQLQKHICNKCDKEFALKW